MNTPLLRRSALALLTLAMLVLSARPAPVGKGRAGMKLDKYLPDDSDGVLVISVKQLLSTPAYKKGLDKEVNALLGKAEVKKVLEGTGFDPLKDVERILVCSAKSIHNEENDFKPGREDGPMVLFEGKFDPAKINARLAGLVKEHPGVLISSDAPGGHKVYRIGTNGPFVAVLDKETMVLAGKKMHVLDALLKSAGKKTTGFVHKDMAARLKDLKTDVPIQGFALPQMVMSSEHKIENDGMGNQKVKSKLITLADRGFKGATLSITVKEDARGSVVFEAKDKETAKKRGGEFTEGLKEAVAMMRKVGDKEPRIAPMLRFLEGVTIKTNGQTITMEGKADPDMVRAFLQLASIAGI
jgi:hypothetical protein